MFVQKIAVLSMQQPVKPILMVACHHYTHTWSVLTIHIRRPHPPLQLPYNSVTAVIYNNKHRYLIFSFVDLFQSLFLQSVGRKIKISITPDFFSSVGIIKKSPFEKQQSVYGWVSQRKFTDKINGLTMG